MVIELGEAGADSDADPALEDLQWAYRSGALVLFVGEGISVAAGLPSREQLAALLLERARAEGAPEAELTEMATLVEKQRIADALSIARAQLGPAALGDILERELNDQ